MASLRAKTESAFKAVIATAVAVPVYEGFAGTDKEGTCIVVKARRAEEDPPFSGNYNITVDILTKGPPDTDGTFDDLALSVRNAIWRDDLNALLQSQATDFYVHGASAPHEMEWEESGDVWVERMTVIIYAAQALTTP